MKIEVNDDNFNLVAAKFYDDIAATDQDFADDLRRFLMLKRLFNHYQKNGELKSRLVINHIIVIRNVFGDATVPLLLHYFSDYKPIITPCLVFLNLMKEPENMDREILKWLKEI